MLSKPQLKKVEKYSLSDEDIRNSLKGINIITYPEFSEIDDVDEILDRYGRCVVLFLTENENTGHWCALFKNNRNEICWFDSYSNKPDEQKSWLSKNKLIQLKQYPNYLTELLKREHGQGFKVTYNPYRLQRMESGVNTCGKHVICRLLHKDMHIDDYVNMIEESGMDPDEYVSNVVFDLIGK